MKRLLPFLLTILLLPTAALADILITEVMASNGVYENGEAYDWVEIHNTGKSAVDLSGYYLSDSKKNREKWAFPSGTKLAGGEYLTVFCTGEEDHSAGKNKTFYAPFKISSSGETLCLTAKDGTELQTLKIPEQFGNISYGTPDNGVTWGYFENATRGKTNEKAVYEDRCAAPELLTNGGFYTGSVTVLASASGGEILRYTTDGETPTTKSPAFPSDGLTVKKTTALRIKAFADGMVSSETVGATYFINDDPVTPIVSLISDNKYLFATSTGALVKGSGNIPNYDKTLEYPINIEYFDENGVCAINQMGTFNVTGHSATQNAQKSIALHARKAWGEEQFFFNPFPTRDYVGYKSILLRAANSDVYATRLRDVIASSLAEGEGILYQDAQLIQVYINGEYWGHYNLREKINKHMVAQYEGVTDEADVDKIDLISRTGRDEFVSSGSGADWIALSDFCKKNDLNKPENLQYVLDNLDVDSLFTHAAYEIILGNVDFTNVRLYRVPGGKWKYLLFDVEASWRGLDKTPLEYYIKPVSGKVQGFRHEPLNALLNVPEYKAKFLTRVAELLEKHFTWPDVKAQFDLWEGRLNLILDRHISRWRNLKRTSWETNMTATRRYARLRPQKIPELLKSAMKLTNAEVEKYFGDVLRLLETTNAKE